SFIFQTNPDYSFTYQVFDPLTNQDFGHSESRNLARTDGEYYVVLPDGRKQVVTYYADKTGYYPIITYE
ncbi:UNVERIFIED_CONTAM: hypothetical protein GTU68_013551, partial [Idotea baltica]|nr:hypothetical protein [Idotea baltica]